MGEFKGIIAGVGVLAILTAAMPNIINSVADLTREATELTPTPDPAGPAPVATGAEYSSTTMIIIASLALAAIVIIGLTISARHLTAQHRIQARARSARHEAKLELWQNGLNVMADLGEAVWNFESDPESVYFTRRLLADVNEPATATFYAAYGAAQSLCTETVPGDAKLLIAFVDAAADARAAFEVADENARRKAQLGISHNNHQLTDAERRKIDQAQKLMRQAHDPALPDAAAHTALAKSLSILKEVGATVPERLSRSFTAAIETRHRRELTR